MPLTNSASTTINTTNNVPLSRVSIVIPTLNEEKALPATLSQLLLQTQAAYEVIIVDGGSQDATCAIAQQWANKLPHVTLLHSATKGRAVQMNMGAAIASGDWLLFLHADTLLPINALASIQAQSSSSVLAGCFKQLFSGANVLLNIISGLHNFRCKLTHIMYGDQSIFVRLNTFKRLQGYSEGHMEDIKFSEDLLTLTDPILLDDYVVTDSRKFKQRGVIRSFMDVVIIVSCYQLKKPIPNFSQSFFSEIR